MKLLCSMIVLFLFAVCGSAQSVPNKSAGPGVAVLEQKWRIDVRNPALEKDPVQAMNDREREERKRKDTEKMNETLSERGMPAKTTVVPGAAGDTGANSIKALYVYEVKLRNTGKKQIRELSWDYVFFEPGTETELGRRRFVSKVNISPGKIRNVVERAATPPTGTIDASRAGKKPQDQYSERIVIQKVEFTDGSVWQSPSN